MKLGGSRQGFFWIGWDCKVIVQQRQLRRETKREGKDAGGGSQEGEAGADSGLLSWQRREEAGFWTP